MKDQQIDFKKEVRNLLRYYDKRLDDCTMAEAKSFFYVLVENSEIDGTLDDFAEHFGKSKVAVSSVIKRRMVKKPKRNVVLYSFHEFLKIIPDSWRRKR